MERTNELTTKELDTVAGGRATPPPPLGFLFPIIPSHRLP